MVDSFAPETPTSKLIRRLAISAIPTVLMLFTALAALLIGRPPLLDLLWLWIARTGVLVLWTIVASSGRRLIATVAGAGMIVGSWIVALGASVALGGI